MDLWKSEETSVCGRIENEKAIVIDAGFSEKEVIKVEAGEVGRVQEKTIAYGRLLP